jgi:hypothetical protein
LLGADEVDLWPEVHAARAARSWPEEIRAVYPHRRAVPHEVWRQLFGSAEREIAILAYSALFLAEDVGLLGLFVDRARNGVRVRIALGDPDSSHVAERGAEEGIGDIMAAKIRNALTLYVPLVNIANVEVRLHRTALYNSLYRADNDLLVNQHAYGIPAVNAPVIHLSGGKTDDMFSGYTESFERIWSSSKAWSSA